MAQRVAPRRRSRLRVRAVLMPRGDVALRDARREANLEGGAFLAELRCECARPECRATFPVAAEPYRRRPSRFIVVPDHLADETVVAAADRFFVVEPQARLDPR
ncbi:MAG TPA: hypothetical protein VKC62_09505 [Gaiellaceae bacterium]|nr:hypothetical protein [Gaiellaceae bacterium]